MDSNNKKVLLGTRININYLLDLKYSKTLYTLKSLYNYPVNYYS